MVNKAVDGTSARQGGTDISVAILVYNEAAALTQLYRALADTLDRLPQSAEIIFADDGSTDGLAERLDAIADVVTDIHPTINGLAAILRIAG